MITRFVAHIRIICLCVCCDDLSQILLTHEHADATLGLDDVRDLGTYEFLQENRARKANGLKLLRTATMPIHVMDTHMESIRSSFPYLFPREVAAASVVPDIRWSPFTMSSSSILVHDLQIDVLPVLHGKNYFCSGFAAGRAPHRFVYLSDVSSVPELVLARLQAEPIALLILDCVTPRGDIVMPTHFNLAQALDLIRSVRPVRTLLVGMSCGFEHVRHNAELAKLQATEGLDVQLAHDGLTLPFEFGDLSVPSYSGGGSL